MPEPHEDVLVVDDNPDLVDALVFLLGEAGYQTRPAYDGQQALAAVEERPPALVLLDMLMPVMDGWEFARAVRERYGAAIPIVVVSAAEHVRRRAQEAGVEEVLPKPVDIDELLSVVARFVPRPSGRGPR